MQLPQTIVYLDDSDDLRLVFQRLVKLKVGIDCLTFANMKDFVAHPTEVLNSKLIFLDINLGPGEPNGIDAYNWLRQQHYLGKILFLTGHGQSHPLVLEAAQFGVEVLAKPISAEFLCNLIQTTIQPQQRAMQ